MNSTVRPARDRVMLAVMGVLLAFLALHALGAILDFRAGINAPLELDYGEGIVWQQAALIPGPRMYGNGQDLPFIVFHYPPLYYLFVHALAPLAPNLLAAGRLASALATVLLAPLASALVLTAARRRGGTEIAVAVAAGLLVLCLHAVRTWGLFMRVDMVAVALGLAGVLAGIWAGGRFWSTVAALLLCTAAVFTKQTELPAGIAVFAVALLLNPRNALAAAGIVGLLGLGALALMQDLTHGGFLQNIVGYNINRFSPDAVVRTLLVERSSLPVAGLILFAAGSLIVSLPRPSSGASWLRAVGLSLHAGDRPAVARAMLLGYFAIASLMLVTLFKSGAAFNYLLDWLCIGVVLVGVKLCDLAMNNRRPFILVALLLILGVAILPFRQLPDRPSEEQFAQHTALVRRIADANKPVASESMTVLMQAGKPVIFEPAIVTELAALGKWNEAPLIDMIRSDGFAFMITTDDNRGGGGRRSAAVDAAMRDAYPRVEQIGPDLWLHKPAD